MGFEQAYRREVIDQRPACIDCLAKRRARRFDGGKEVHGFMGVSSPRHPVLRVGHPPGPTCPSGGHGG